MNIINLKDIKTRGTKALKKEEPNYLVVNSKPEYVITSKENYEAMEQIVEDYLDLLDVEARKNEELIPAEEFFKNIE